MQRHLSRWIVAASVLVAGIGFSAAAQPAEAGHKAYKKFHEKRYKAMKKAHKRYERDLRRHSRHRGHALPGVWGPRYRAAPSYPYSYAHPYSMPGRGFSFGFHFQR